MVERLGKAAWGHAKENTMVKELTSSSTFSYFDIAFKGMKHRKLRSWLTILGIVIGVAAIVSLITVAQGFESAIQHQFEQMGVSNIRVVPGNLIGPPAGDIGYSKDLIERVDRIHEVAYVNPVIMNFVPIKSRQEESFAAVVGYDPQLSDKGFVDVDINVEEGRLFKPGDANRAIIGHDVAYDAFEKDIHLDGTLEIQDRDFKVIGIFEDTGSEVDGNVYIPIETARDLFDNHDKVNVMVVKIKEGISLEEGAAAIEKELEDEIDDGEVELFTPQQLLGQLTDILGVVSFVLVGIAAISLLVGAVGIMNAVFTSVLERTRDIGVMKAIGARNSNIFLLFLIEAGLVGLVGGIIGLIIGVVFSFAVEQVAALQGFTYLQIGVTPGVVAFALGFSFVLGSISGLLPAMRAARLNPVDALRYE